MKTLTLITLTTALAAPLPALAQTAESQTQEGTTQGPATTDGTAPQGQMPGTDPSQTTQGGDSVLATVGDAEIRGSDVAMVIGTLPPQLRAQPVELLIPMALEQLILRELILARAEQANLADDPEVQGLAQGGAERVQQDAMVQVWLQRELDNRVNDQAVQSLYDETTARTEGEDPPLEEVRPQIEQFLRQQALDELRVELQSDGGVTFYGPDGQPMAAQSRGSGGDASGDGASGGDTSGGAGTQGN